MNRITQIIPGQSFKLIELLPLDDFIGEAAYIRTTTANNSRCSRFPKSYYPLVESKIVEISPCFRNKTASAVAFLLFP